MENRRNARWVQLTAVPRPDSFDDPGKALAVQPSCVVSLAVGSLTQAGVPPKPAAGNIAQIKPREMACTVLCMLDGTQLSVQEDFNTVIAKLREAEAE